jgi:replicative DNA helicase
MNHMPKLYSEEAETLLLGVIFNRTDIQMDVFNLLDESDFFIPKHRQLFQVMKMMFLSSEHIEITSLAMKLKSEYVSVKEWIIFLTDLASMATASLNVQFYLQEILLFSHRRKGVDIGRKLQEGCCYEDMNQEDVNKVFEDTQQSLFLLKSTTPFKKEKTIADLILQPNAQTGKTYREELAERQEYFKSHGIADPSKLGVKTGFRSLDRYLNGLGRGNLIIIAGRPGMGKTTFALNIADNLATQSNLPIAFFSMEMTEDEILEKVISIESVVSGDAIKKGNINEQQNSQIELSLKRMEKTPFIINGQSSLTIQEIRDLSRRYIEKFGVKLIVIDYLQLISSPSSKKTENRNQEISAISRGLKIMAKDLDVPVIALSQLSRKTEERKTGPLLSDLRDSGAIEQDADQVVFVDRDGERSDIIIAKNRHGETGKFALQFKGDVSKFYELAWDYRNEEAQ